MALGGSCRTRQPSNGEGGRGRRRCQSRDRHTGVDTGSLGAKQRRRQGTRLHNGPCLSPPRPGLQGGAGLSGRDAKDNLKSGKREGGRRRIVGYSCFVHQSGAMGSPRVLGRCRYRVLNLHLAPPWEQERRERGGRRGDKHTHTHTQKFASPLNRAGMTWCRWWKEVSRAIPSRLSWSRASNSLALSV